MYMKFVTESEIAVYNPGAHELNEYDYMTLYMYRYWANPGPYAKKPRKLLGPYRGVTTEEKSMRDGNNSVSDKVKRTMHACQPIGCLANFVREWDLDYEGEPDVPPINDATSTMFMNHW
jgi:hypothetical protein